ncbi:MAG: threonylcarbamoyl-AMP synthase [Micrococcales bacterium]|nr:threonylcarbamoyl-AMP synthase [Micrococcales bacterium]
MSPVVDATSEDGRREAIDQAAEAVRHGEVVVLPTDTVYGIGCDAFRADAVAALLAAKGRGREMPPPVLIPNARTVDGLADSVRDYTRRLIGDYWPGPLTIVVQAQPSLMWDLGETNGTVALRQPDSEIALALLQEIGPMAVTSANRTGSPAATTVLEAATQLGSAVSVYLDGGPCADNVPSTIVDCTGPVPVVLREGAIPAEEIMRVADVAEPDDGAGQSDVAEPEGQPAVPGEGGQPEGDARDDYVSRHGSGAAD